MSRRMPAGPGACHRPGLAVAQRRGEHPGNRRYGIGAFIQRAATHWIFLLLGLGGYALVLRRWPQYLTFLPPLLLGLAGYFLGHRFAMYAAPALGLGLGLGLALAVERLDLVAVKRHRVCKS